MSHDVLYGLRRRLVTLIGRERGYRRSSERTGTSDRYDSNLRADGGEEHGRGDDEHLRDLPDGAGCTEIWEHLSERGSGEGRADD